MDLQFLIVEDDSESRKLIASAVAALGHEVDQAEHGREGLMKALAQDYALVVLDINLPGISGIEICRQVRSKKPLQPILMLTARTDELDKVLALELGADDYVTKPFSVRELQARIGAILRRVERQRTTAAAESSEGSRLIVAGDLVIDQDRHEVHVGARKVELTAIEWDLLLMLATNRGRVLSREELMNSLWGYSAESCEYIVNSHLSRLRGKIEEDPRKARYIVTVRGFGYRFADSE